MPDLTAEPKGLPEVRDALLSAVLAFGATTTVYSASVAIDLNALTVKGLRPENCEVRVSTIDLTTATIGNTETIKVSLVGDTALPIDASSVVLAADCLSYVGGGGVGDKGKYWRQKLASDNLRYLGLKIVSDSDANDDTQFATIEIVF